MGVVYKLKQEVIDYILELKKLDENLSCRKISELASARFQRKISKSSINAILKDSSLSSPVGRRGRKRSREDKFKIPAHRKEQIFVNIPATILTVQPQPPAVVSVKPLLENSGIFFLKAAEWQMKRQGVLRFLCEKYSTDTHEEKILKAAESFLFLPVFGVRCEEDFLSFDNKSFWDVNDLETKPTTYQKAESFDVLKSLEKNRSQVLLEHGQIFSEASFFQVFLEDGTSFCLDCQNNSSWDEDNVHCDFSSCLDKSFDFLSKNIINNSQPVILRQAASEGNFSPSFLSMMAAFENIPGKRMKRVDLLTSKKEIISSFEKLLHKRRFFIIGIYDCDDLAQKILGNKQQMFKTFSSATQKTYRYATATTAFRLPGGTQASSSIIFVRAENSDDPQFGLLTNMVFKDGSVDETIRLFLERWPNPVRGHAYFQERRKTVLASSRDIISYPDEKIEHLSCEKLFEEKSFLSQSANAILLRIHDYACRHFFPVQWAQISFEEATRKIYSLSGEVVREKDRVCIKIASSKQENSALQIAFAIERINESAIHDPQGRRIFFI